MSRVGRSSFIVPVWLLVFALSCSGEESQSEGVDAFFPDIGSLDLHFGSDQGTSDLPFGEDEATDDQRLPPDLRSDHQDKDIGAECGSSCDVGQDQMDVQPETAGPCELNPLCEKDSVQTEGCGNCGTRSRQCNDQCQYGLWSECMDQGPCEFGAKEEEECGVAGDRFRLCTESCVWGEWSPCANQGSCEPGDSQTEACGMCGQRTRGCSAAYQWNPWGLCLNQGVCVVDDVNTLACGNCGTQSQLCDATCQWGEPSQCTGEGECVPDAQQAEPCGNCGVRTRSCTTLCVWSDWSLCQGEGECAPLAVEALTCGKCGSTTRKCTGLCEWGEPGPCEGQGECVAGQAASCDNCGYQLCSSSCTWGSCNIGGEDTFEQNDTQATAYDLGSMGDNEQGQVIGANINPSFDSDWYKVAINDLDNQAINPRFTLRNVPAGQTYHIYVVYDCLKSDIQYSADMVVTSSGTISLNVDGCFDVFIFSDDSGTALIRVEPETPGSCSDYELEVVA